MKSRVLTITACAFFMCALLVLSVSAMGLTEAGEILQKYDIDGDGAITITDVTELLKYLSTNCGHQSEPIPYKAPGCTEDGHEGGRQCALCKVVLEEPWPVFQTGHDYDENGVCAHCGDELYSQHLEYEFDETLGGYVLVDYGNCTDADVVIQPSYNGYPVVAIDGSAFARCTEIVSVTIPGSVKRIGNSAFARCTALEKVILEKGIEEIGGAAFSRCTALTEIEIPSTVKTMGEGVFDGFFIRFQDLRHRREGKVATAGTKEKPVKVDLYLQIAGFGHIFDDKFVVDSGVSVVATVFGKRAKCHSFSFASTD